jgi:hypothetical protein
MNLIPFVMIFPEQGERETRTITTRGHHLLPDDEYALVDAYCPDPACDCRRVLLNVVGRRQMRRGYLASISFAFDREADLAGPLLDPLNPQSPYAEALFAYVAQILATDPAYVDRLERHYQQIKAANDPSQPGHQMLTRLSRPAGLNSWAQPKRRPGNRQKRKRR